MLATEVANVGTVAAGKRVIVDSVLRAGKSEIMRIVTVETSNGQPMLSGGIHSGPRFWVGVFNTGNARITLGISSSGSSTLFSGKNDVISHTDVQSAVGALDGVIIRIAVIRQVSVRKKIAE